MTQQILNYTYHENFDIHEFQPLVSTREVLNPYIEILDRIIPETIEQAKSCALILWTLDKAEIFPLRLQNAYFQKLVEKYPKIPPAYVAYITDRTSDATLIRANYTSRKDTREIFAESQHEDAIQWLLERRQNMSDSKS